jgi:hypothetical protein
LNSDTFKVRGQANLELQKLDNEAKPFLREALKAQATLEARRPVEGLLERLRDLEVTDLEIPVGVTVLTVDALVAAYKDLKAADTTVCALAVHDLSRLAAWSDLVVPP